MHYDDVIMNAIASQITSLTIVYSIVYSDAHQRKHQSSASLAFVRGIHRGPVNSPHKWPVTRKMFPFDDVIMVLWDLLYSLQFHNRYSAIHHPINSCIASGEYIFHTRCIPGYNRCPFVTPQLTIHCCITWHQHHITHASEHKQPTSYLFARVGFSKP